MFQYPASGSSHFYDCVAIRGIRYYQWVSMPYLGLIPFLQSRELDSLSSLLVSMPYLGLIPFLLLSDRDDVTVQELFQCPISGSSHFYNIMYSFRSNKVRFNALSRDHPISTRHQGAICSSFLFVSMPYLGLIPFLPERSGKSLSLDLTVSMPYLGLIPFLHDKCMERYYESVQFQCPISGSSHFYKERRCIMFDTLAFQCPISGSSHFYSTGDRDFDWRLSVSMPYLGLIPFLPIPKK